MVKLGTIIGFCIGFLDIIMIRSVIPNIVALKLLRKKNIPIEKTLSEKLSSDYINLIKSSKVSFVYYSRFYQRLLVFLKLFFLILSFILVGFLIYINFTELGEILNMEV